MGRKKRSHRNNYRNTPSEKVRLKLRRNRWRRKLKLARSLFEINEFKRPEHLRHAKKGSGITPEPLTPTTAEPF